MAPEQLTRGEATIQSDPFALGLILAEIFTGRAVLKAGSTHDLIRAHESLLSQTMARTEDIDPTVQRAIRRCLEREPHERPASARAVAAGLPGGDPLAAALASGETPSTEMVAASGESGQLSLRTAGVCLAALLAGLACLILIMGRTSATIDLDKSVDGYAERADNMLDGLGLDDDKVYEDWVYEDWGFAETKEVPRRMEFWYRRSPQRLVPLLDSGHVRERPRPAGLYLRRGRDCGLRPVRVLHIRGWLLHVWEPIIECHLAGIARQAALRSFEAKRTVNLLCDCVQTFTRFRGKFGATRRLIDFSGPALRNGKTTHGGF